MKKLGYALIPLFALLVACGNVTDVPTNDLPEEEPAVENVIPGSYIIALKPLADAGDDITLQHANLLSRAERILADGARGGNLSLATTDSLVALPIIDGFAVENITPEVATALANHPEVALIEPDRIVRAAGTQSNAPWNLDRIDSTFRAFDNTFTYRLDGNGVTVYVVDSGVIRNDVELPRVQPGREYITKGVGIGVGTEDCYGHGTQVASVIASRTYGVAKGVTIIPLKVINCEGMGRTSHVTSALNEILWMSRGGGTVVNLSLGDVGQSWALDHSIRTLTNANITVVTAAGNNRTDACLFSPGRERSAITVGASNYFDARAPFSNYGACVDIYAPGETVNVLPNRWGENTVGIGTSFAAAHVSGLAAMIIQSNPNLTPAEVSRRITNGGSRSVTNTITGTNKLLYTGLRLTAPPSTTTFKCTQCVSVNTVGRMPTAPWVVATPSDIEGWASANTTPYSLWLETWSPQDGSWILHSSANDVRRDGLPFLTTAVNPGVYRWRVITDSSVVPYATVQYRSSTQTSRNRPVTLTEQYVQGTVRAWVDGTRSTLIIERLRNGVWSTVQSSTSGSITHAVTAGPVRVRVVPATNATTLRWGHTFD